jgi:hypothetical protein
VKDKESGSSLTRGDRRCIISLAMKVGGLKVVETNF